MTSPPSDNGEADLKEASGYSVLQPYDVDPEPPLYWPLGPGDVFDGIELGHLAEPFTGLVMVVGHPCSIRAGMKLQNDIPVAPIEKRGLPTDKHPLPDRLFPLGKLVPPGATSQHMVNLSRTTTVPAADLVLSKRVATLSNAGIVALQQRVVSNAIRAKIPTGVIASHCRGPFIEVELWRDWREAFHNANADPDVHNDEFDQFMDSPSGFKSDDTGEDLSWRSALAEHETARGGADRALSVIRKDRLAVLSTSHVELG